MPRFGHVVAFVMLLAAGIASAQTGLPTQTWPAGTRLATWNHGGRITTFHRGLLYLGGTENQGTHVYDIVNPQSPQLRCSIAASVNGHAWQKIGDLFYRQYWNPDIGDPPPNNRQFVSLADPCNRAVWTQPIHDFPVVTPMWGGGFMDTYPFWFGEHVWDARIGWWPQAAPGVNVNAMAGINAGNRFRVGNLLFLMPGDGQSGVAVLDIGNPTAPVLLDTLAGNYLQYTTAWQLWRHHLVMMIGDDTNGPAANRNTLVIDFSDPTDLRVVHTIPFADLPGRYAHFQDEFAFAGRGNRGVKYDMVNRRVVREFSDASFGFGDFQWIPLGHLLLVSSSETNGSRSALFTHQDGLDTRPPTVGYHRPLNGAVNQPRTTAVGLVIHETLDATTVNESTIQLRAFGGAQVPAVVIHTSYGVVNVVPVSPLAANTTYELRLVGGGVRDVAGNAIAPFSFYFSTGATIDAGAGPVVDGVTANPVSPAPTATNVLFTASASDPQSRPLEYRWNHGDGSAETAWSASASSSHAYAQPGQYTVQVQVRNDASQVASATTTLVVRQPGANGRASSSIVVHPTRREVWSVNPDHGNVAVLDADAMTRLAKVATGAHPAGVAVDGAGRAWVANRDADTLSRIDPATRAVTQTIALEYGDRPVAIVFAPDGTTGYVALSGPGEVARFSTTTNAIDVRRAAGPHLEALALSPDGSRLFATRMVSGGAGGTIWRVDLPAFGAAQPISLPTDGATVDSGTAGRGTPNYVGALAASPDGSRLWYGGKKDNVLRGLRRDGAPLTFESTLRSLVGAIDVPGNAEIAAARLDVDDSSRAAALALAPGASHLFVAFDGNNRVVALDPWNRREIARADTGLAPQGLAFDAATGRLFVRNFLGRTVTVLAANAMVTEGAGALPVLATIAASATEPLPATVLAGKRHFHNAADPRMSEAGYIACAGCHLDGRQDGRTWDFSQLGEGLRNTQSLRGVAGLGHGLLHWSGNFDEVQDFETPIRNLFGGLGFMDDAMFNAGTRAQPLGTPKAGASAPLDALAAYVASLNAFDRSPFRTAQGALTADGVAGRAIFVERGCHACHAGAAFTDSANGTPHDVGTLTANSGQRLGGALTAIDTPTLRGLWNTAPYLHDGSAATLDDVLVARNPSGAHGNVSVLTPGQRAQLVAFLLQVDGSEPAMPAAGTLFSHGFED